ncbi:hypothetical protein [Demequina iriomotensis]|uniref:hypothetical protein n=1 Tax=Demequina iriomotensis TaxID=1536641 RepID=UPI000780C3BC|nr:hypothetical protein [Demequina iriomotensis]
MTATAHRGYELGVGDDAPHRHLMDRLRRHRDAAAEARHRARAEHRRQRHDLHERELEHDPRDQRARHTLESGGIRPFIIA